ncbi:hypothetical protein J4E93_006006 [Alternaria ventricosa]|uniref:uncharacterized protein n=1 Tax=Alternaria ventricosa TaxID=1187951 RepID=UPI0020C22E8E|nr:uncharacterized protein J4E93_006006 [Alternaria ventricosa]KAI4645206.1 hypothetical protein J4E93_006006 [Alternaria ventricosa]
MAAESRPALEFAKRLHNETKKFTHPTTATVVHESKDIEGICAAVSHILGTPIILTQIDVNAMKASLDSDRTVLTSTTSCLDRARASLESMTAAIKCKWAVAGASDTGLPTVQPHQVEKPGD